MSKGSFPIDAAQVVGLFMESIFYGCIFLVSFFDCMRVLLWSGGRFKTFRLWNKKMVVASLLMFTFASLDVAFHLRHNLEAFIWFDGDPIEDFDSTSNWLNVIAMGCYVAQTFVGDAILIFRCWIVYDKRLVVVTIPTLLWLATSVCGAMTIYVEATIDTSGKLLNASTLVPFITSMLCLTLATNIITTSLIVYRIWAVQKGLRHRSAIVVSQSPLTRVAVVLVESGLLYTMSIIILFGLYMASNNGQYGVSNAVVQIIGITFNLIITRVDRTEGGAIQDRSSYAPDRPHTMNHSRSSGGVPLHMINIQTTVSRFQDPSAQDTTKSNLPGSVEEGLDGKSDWKD